MRIPENQIEFEKMFTTEEQCLDYLKELRFPKGYSCRKCQHNEYWLNNRGIMICKNCKNELSITSGTIFHRSKLPHCCYFQSSLVDGSSEKWSKCSWHPKGFRSWQL